MDSCRDRCCPGHPQRPISPGRQGEEDGDEPALIQPPLLTDASHWCPTLQLTAAGGALPCATCFSQPSATQPCGTAQTPLDVPCSAAHCLCFIQQCCLVRSAQTSVWRGIGSQTLRCAAWSPGRHSQSQLCAAAACFQVPPAHLPTSL